MTNSERIMQEIIEREDISLENPCAADKAWLSDHRTIKSLGIEICRYIKEAAEDEYYNIHKQCYFKNDNKRTRERFVDAAARILSAIKSLDRNGCFLTDEEHSLREKTVKLEDRKKYEQKILKGDYK